MAASNTDKFTKSAIRFTTTIGAGGVADASVTTIPLTTTTNLPTDTAVYASIDRVDSDGNKTLSKWEVVKGVVSGSNLTTCLRGQEGTAQAHTAGAVVEIILVSSQWDDLIDGILEEHNQDGTHDSAVIAKLAGAQTFTGAKTFSTAPLFTFGSEAAGDTFYGAADGTITRLPKGSDGQVLTLASGVPAWASNTSSVASSSNSVGSDFTTTSTSLADVTDGNQSVTFTGTKNILIIATIKCQNDTDGAYFSLGLKRDSTTLLTTTVDPASASTGDVRTLSWLDTSVSAGTYDYKIAAAAQTGKTTRILAGSQITVIVL